MAYSSTVLSQIIRFLPRHEFESLAKQHHAGHELRSFNRWSQFVALMVAQVAGRKSLRDLVENLKVQGRKLYHLGMLAAKRSTLARINEQQPHTLYEALFYKLLARCQGLAPKNRRFKVDGKVYLLDTSLISLCLSVFPWATYRQKKGAVRLHVGLDADGYLPEFVAVTEGRKPELAWAKALKLPKGSVVVFDRGFTDYRWYQALTEAGVFFVTRLKSNALVEYCRKRAGRKAKGVLQDQEIGLKGVASRLRLVRFVAEDGREYRFLTNARHLPAATVADLYKERWQIELFFKWIKQNLKVKTFLGASKNAVLTQLWVALCVYLMLAWLKFIANLGMTMQRILQLLQLNLFARRDLKDLLDPLEPPQITQASQLALL